MKTQLLLEKIVGIIAFCFVVAFFPFGLCAGGWLLWRGFHSGEPLLMYGGLLIFLALFVLGVDINGKRLRQ